MRLASGAGWSLPCPEMTAKPKHPYYGLGGRYVLVGSTPTMEVDAAFNVRVVKLAVHATLRW